MYQVALGFLQISHPCNFSILENVNLSSQPKSFNRSKHIFRKFHFLKIKAASTASHFWALPDWRPAALLMETSLKTEEDGEGMARSRGCTLAGTRWRHGGKRDIATQTSLSVPHSLWHRWEWMGGKTLGPDWSPQTLVQDTDTVWTLPKAIPVGGTGQEASLRENETNKLSKLQGSKLGFQEFLLTKLLLWGRGASL